MWVLRLSQVCSVFVLDTSTIRLHARDVIDFSGWAMGRRHFTASQGVIELSGHVCGGHSCPNSVFILLSCWPCPFTRIGFFRKRRG